MTDLARGMSTAEFSAEDLRQLAREQIINAGTIYAKATPEQTVNLIRDSGAAIVDLLADYDRLARENERLHDVAKAARSFITESVPRNVFVYDDEYVERLHQAFERLDAAPGEWEGQQ